MTLYFSSLSASPAPTMWPWQPQQSTSSAHYPSSPLTYHHPQAPHDIVSPHTHTLPASVHTPPSHFPSVGGPHYIYPPTNPTGEFPFSSHIASPVPVDGWAEPRQSSVQSDSVTLPFSSPLQPRADVHITAPIPTLPPPPIHPSQQTTSTNVHQQPQQPSPLPLTPSHPPQTHTHTVTRSPFSMDFILREHAPSAPDGPELAQPVAQYPQGAGPAQADLRDPVTPGYQSGLGDIMYQTPPQSHPPLPPHPHTPSPQLQQSIAQGYIEGGGVKQVTFDPGTHYGDQPKGGLFVPSAGETGERLSTGQIPSTTSPVPEARPFSDNVQQFPLHSNYPAPVSRGTGKIDMESDGNEAPYSPPELIPEHQEGDQSDSLNQSQDHSSIQSECVKELTPSVQHSGPPLRVGEGTNAAHEHFSASNSIKYDPHKGHLDSTSPGGMGGEPNVTKCSQSSLNTMVMTQTAAIPSSVSPHVSLPGSPASDSLVVDVTGSPKRENKSLPNNDESMVATAPPSHLPMRRSESPSMDDLDMRPSAPKPPPLLRRGHNHSSDEEDDVFLPPHHNPSHPLTITPSQEAPPSHTPSSPPTYIPPPTTSPSPPHSPPAQPHSGHDSEVEEEKMETMTTTPSKTPPTSSKCIMLICCLFACSQWVWSPGDEEGACPPQDSGP